MGVFFLHSSGVDLIDGLSITQSLFLVARLHYSSRNDVTLPGTAVTLSSYRLHERFEHGMHPHSPKHGIRINIVCAEHESSR